MAAHKPAHCMLKADSLEQQDGRVRLWLWLLVLVVGREELVAEKAELEVVVERNWMMPHLK